MTKQVVCPVCDGRGFVSWINNTEDTCSTGSKTCPHCKGTGLREVEVTNADHIRSMTDEELAGFLDGIGAYTGCEIICGGDCKAIATLTKTAEQRRREIILEKLRQPYKEKRHEQTIGADAEA